MCKVSACASLRNVVRNDYSFVNTDLLRSTCGVLAWMSYRGNKVSTSLFEKRNKRSNSESHQRSRRVSHGSYLLV
jgi:hypothetical protein